MCSVHVDLLASLSDCTFKLVVHTTDRGADEDGYWVSEGTAQPAALTGTPDDAVPLSPDGNVAVSHTAQPVSLDARALATQPLFHLQVCTEALVQRKG